MIITSKAADKLRRTREQLADLVFQKAKDSGKCSDLAGIIVIGPVQRGHANWDVGTQSANEPAPICAACRIELTKIVG